MDISVATSAVSQRTMGRPAGLMVELALPGRFSSTKRFISATRAAGVSRSKDSLLRCVRNRENPAASCEHAASSTSRNAVDGPLGEAIDVGGVFEPSGAGTPGAPAFVSGRELDSCACACLANNIIATAHTHIQEHSRQARAENVRRRVIHALAGLKISARFCV